MLRVLSAGVGRSGSTWLFNAAMALLNQRYRAYGAWVDRWDAGQAANADALVLAVHSPEQIGDFAPDVVFTCHRDLRDVALSLRDYQKLETDDAVLKGVSWARVGHDAFAPKADLDVPYEQMMLKPLTALGDLALALDVSAPDLGAARAIVEAWEPRPGGRKHRFDGRPGRWREQLEPHLRQSIEETHGVWLRRMGYAL
jgi:hypothetical protein